MLGSDAASASMANRTAAGILTLLTKSDRWSYAMAVGFIAALLASGSLLLPANTPAQGSPPIAAARGQ